MNHHNPRILVGVVPKHLAAVVTAAAMFAEQFGADLICASVDGSSHTVEEHPDGSVGSIPINADLPFYQVQVFDPELRAELAKILDPRCLRWSVRALAGGPSQELARLADELDATMIVVGTRETGFRGSLHQFFNGSVAANLAHRQHRPLVVIPVNPITDNNALPWQEDN